MKTLVLSIVCIALFVINISAQGTELNLKNYVGVGIGYSFDHINDQNLSPLNQKGNSLFYTIFYERRSENILKIALTYGDGNLKSGLKDKFDTSYYVANLSVSYYRNLSSAQSATKFYLGGTYNLKVLYTDWFDQDAFSYLTTNGLSISGAISQRINEKQYVESTLSVPFLLFLSRPPYNGIDETIIENQDEPIAIILDGKLTSFKKYRAITWNVNYNREIFRRFNWKVDYTLNVQKVTDVNEYKSISNLVSTSLIYKF